MKIEPPSERAWARICLRMASKVAELMQAAGTRPEDRDTIRGRLLELFEVVGRTDPAVLKARRRLATVLF